MSSTVILSIQVFCLAASFSAAPPDDTLPSPEELIEKMAQSRETSNALFYWRLREEVKLENGETAVRDWGHTTKFAGSDCLDVDHGGPDGVRFVEQLGEPNACYAHYQLISGGKFYEHLSNSHNVRYSPDSHPYIIDIRTVGLLPAPWANENPESIRRFAEANAEWEVERNGATLRLTCHKGGGKVTWDLDPEKDYAVTRVRSEPPAGEGVLEAISELEDFDGAWFPSKVTYIKEGRKREIIVEHIEKGTLDQDSISFAELDLHDGVQLNEVPAGGGYVQTTIWDGQQFIPIKEWFARGDFTERDEFEARMEATNWGAYPDPARTEARRVELGVGRSPKLWEPYVREFLRTHKLEGKAVRRAWKLLRECQRPAYKHLKEYKGEIGDVEEKIAALKSQLSKGEAPEGEARRLELMEEHRESMFDPVDNIFHKQLKPGLERLLGEPVESTNAG